MARVGNRHAPVAGQAILIKKTAAWALIVITVGLVCVALLRPNPPAWNDPPTPLQSGVQRPSGRDPQQGMGRGGAPCPFEDGDPSGHPCWWTDADGSIYYVDSSEYRGE